MLTKLGKHTWQIKDKIKYWLGAQSAEEIEEQLRYATTNKIDDFDIFGKIVPNLLKYLDMDHVTRIAAASDKYDQYMYYQMEKPGEERISRPINFSLFITDAEDFKKAFKQVKHDLTYSNSFSAMACGRLQKVIYTIAMSLGIAVDFVLTAQEGRKNLGCRIEDMYSRLLDELNITYTNEIQPYGKSRIDIIISPYDEVKSGPEHIDTDEIFCSVKFSSKDRMKTIFSDKEDLEEACGEEIKMVANFVHDVQRNKKYKVSKTFSTNIFRTKHSDSPLAGIYYLDKPNNDNNIDINREIKTAAIFFVKNLPEMLGEKKDAEEVSSDLAYSF